ncbi:MAG: RNA methyltransferase [Spirochaetaceae bacterium]|nr:RNA methyltransferase [Myxococcales bacterium]MCB9724835.1 RNA methyltransferase [Spirochaetaceae bacterium]
MRSEPIADLHDPRIDDYRNLKDATLASSRHRFIVEGRGNLLVLLSSSSHRPASILLSRRTFDGLAADLERLAPDCPIYVAEQALLDAIVGYPIHRGCLAACDRGAARDALGLVDEVLSERPAARFVLLEGLTNHDNVGGIFRNAMALGADAVLLCPRCCDPLYRKAVRTSMGGVLVVPFAQAEDLGRLLDGLRARGVEVLALDPGEPGEDLAAMGEAPAGPVALLLGTEGPGLTQEALARADRRVRIAMRPGVDSLNVAVAAGIALHRLFRPAETSPVGGHCG